MSPSTTKRKVGHPLGKTRTGRGRRAGGKPVYVRVNVEERAQIEADAAATGLSEAEVMRQVYFTYRHLLLDSAKKI